ncbi:hypothetical protein J437_LFUL001818 [Ladona fulva]|uniref:Uncharacterized protein n=1 Tax=Ladona fulva TaxID=123851 RepID=A0A8K0JX91_LADFU|nr:hypothetical protein J437_LFUL001818 [Ladona fulva]
MKKKLDDIEEYSKQNEVKKFYNTVEKGKNGNQPRMEGLHLHPLDTYLFFFKLEFLPSEELEEFESIAVGTLSQVLEWEAGLIERVLVVMAD